MKNITFLLIVGISFMMSHSACTQNNQVEKAVTSNLIFKSNLRADGTSFYALDSKTGQLHFMLDYGDDRGKWQAYGDVILKSGPGLFQFDVVERPGATSFYAMNSMNGQLYYSDDNPETGGNWKPYGDVIRQNGVNKLQFEATGRFEGNSFYAFDSMSGQMYFMNDFEDGAGKWKKYGNQLLN